MLNPRFDRGLRTLCRQSSRYLTTSPKSEDRSLPTDPAYNVPEIKIAHGIALISQGLTEISKVLVTKNVPQNRTLLSKIPEFTSADQQQCLNKMCVLLESLRQLLNASIDHKLKDDFSVMRVSEPLAPNEILVRTSPPPPPPQSAPSPPPPRQPTPPSSARERTFESITTKTPQLSQASKAKRVPASRIGRALTYGNLFAGVGLGAATEAVRRIMANDSSNSLILSEANANRVVETLCQVRGAALKIGQILSIQDTNLIPAQIQDMFLRVRDSAHYMPKWQLNRVMTKEWGSDWRSKLSEFEEMPFAAASIGQVHRGTVNGSRVAIKIQYPGVAHGINSDIDNLMMILKIWDIIPKGFFIHNLVEVARRELAWEVDYRREAEASLKFRELLKDSRVFTVPDVITELSTDRVLVTELIPDAVPVDRLENASQELRNYISENLLKLTLQEIFEFRYMQTDPNWSNFLYQPDTQKIILLDFGASRSYDKDFIDVYLMIIDAAIEKDEATVIDLSKQLGFLSGEETEEMIRAHCEAVLLLAEAFTVNEFDFSLRETERKVSQLVPIMLKHRLVPPPEEIYSLHRKLSGMFLLCSKLRAKINCRDMYFEVRNKYKMG